MLSSSINFWKDCRGEYGYLTSDYVVQFSDEERTYISLTQYLHYHRAILCGGSEELKQQILSTSIPKVLRQLGAGINDTKEWKTQHEDFIEQGVSMKFKQNKALADALIKTGSATLIEGHPTEERWNIQVARKNLLGKALMRLRHEIVLFPL